MSSEGSGGAGGISSLLRWRPAIFGLTAFAAGLTIYYASLSDHGRSAENGSAPGLRRSNAIRRSPRLRHARASIAADAVTDRPSTATAGQQEREQGQGQEDEWEENHRSQREQQSRRHQHDQQNQQPQQDSMLGDPMVGPQDTDDEDEDYYDPTRSVNGDAEGGQSLLNLLYHIAEEQAHREGYVHRGVTCNSCNMLPIKGIRYRCANCPDYDLCEQCENLGVHDKTHLFYKIRIPAPFLGSNPRNQQPVWYPGKPYGLPRSIPKELKSKLLDLTGFDRSRIDALWEQFKSLAAVDWPDDPNGLRVAIDKKIWAKYCMPTMLREHEAPSALIFDQSFTFYDDNEDGLVGFEEFLGGLAAKQGKDQQEKLRRIFRAHDLDRDGYVCREDFTRLFTSNYTFMRELSRDLSHIMYEEILDDRPLRENLRGAQPVSSCFTGAIPSGDESRIGEGKTVSSTGDWVVTDGGGFIREPDTGLLHDQEDAGSSSRSGVISSLFADFGQPIESWPPHYVLVEDAYVALGKPVELCDVTAIADQQRVLDVANERVEHTISHASMVTSLARSSRINGSPSSDESSPDTINGSGQLGQETPETESERSHALPLVRQQKGKLPAVEASFAQEYLYQATREGFDEVLDPMFRQMEDLYEFYERAGGERARLQDEIRIYRAKSANTKILHKLMTRTLRLWRKGEIESSAWVGTRLAEEIIRMLMKEQEPGTYEWVACIIDRIYSSTMTEEQLDEELEKLAAGQLDPSQGLSRKLKYAWWTAKHGTAPNPEQLDEFLDNGDVRMQGQNVAGDDGDDNEGQPSNAAVGVINVDEQLIQELLDGENEGSDPPYELNEAYPPFNATEPLSEEQIRSLPEDLQLELARQYASQSIQLTNGSILATGHQSQSNDAEAESGGASALPGNQDQGDPVSQVQAEHEQDGDGEREGEGEGDDSEENVRFEPAQIVTAMRDLNHAFEDFNFELFMDEMEVEEHVDPTLPQNRPDVVHEDHVGTSFSSQVAQRRATEQTSRDMSKQYLRWTAVNQQGSISSMEQRDPLEDQTGSYFQVKLKYLSMLEMFAEQQDFRGGPSHLDRAEFEEIMLGQKGRRLETIGKWLDLAAF